MSYKKILLVLGSVLLLLTALTFYLNRVIFPQLIKNFTIQQLEKNLRRKVEIRTMHFNWFKGFVMDDIKIYEKNSSLVFAKADHISFGLIIIPGLKHYKLTIPFIHVHAPFINLLRNQEGIWNFQDLQNSPMALQKNKGSSSSPITWGGLTITDGQCLLQDGSLPHPWSELFDHINLKFSLSYKGIEADLSTEIPKENGLFKALVGYQPIDQNASAHIDLKNINIASYLSLFKIPVIEINKGMVKSMSIEMHRTADQTVAEGDAVMTNMDIAYQGRNLKSNITVRGLKAEYDKGSIKGYGQLVLSEMTINAPEFSGTGSLAARIDHCQWRTGDFMCKGNLSGQSVKLDLHGQNMSMQNLKFDNIDIHKDQRGLHATADLMTHDLFIHSPHQLLKTDLTINALEIKALDENHILSTGDVLANNFTGQQGDDTLTSAKIHLGKLAISLTDQKNLSLTTALWLEQAALIMGETVSVSGSFKADKLELNLNDKSLELSTSASTSQGHFVLRDKTIDANPHLELAMKLPFEKGLEATYQGSIVFSDATIGGIGNLPMLTSVALDADFKTDTALVNALSLDVFNTNVQIQGTVKNFKDPWLDIELQASEFNLAEIKNIAPALIADYGLDLKGTGTLKASFKGLLSDPLTAHRQATLSLNHASIRSRPLQQKIENVSGLVTASDDTLVWHDIKASFLGKRYASQGRIDNFKHPKITAALNSENLQLQIQASQNNDNLDLHRLTGRLFNVDLDAQGVITLRKNQPPYFNLSTQAAVNLEDLSKALPDPQKKNLLNLSPTGYVSMHADVKGAGLDWKNYYLNATLNSPSLVLMGYTLANIKIDAHQHKGKAMDVTMDGRCYDGSVHAVASLDLVGARRPYTLALNIDATDLHKLKIDSPLKMEEINGKLYLTAIADGTMADFKKTLNAKGSIAIKEGYLGQFSVFLGLLSALNDALHLGQIMITDVDGNFTVAHQRITTDNLRLKGPTIALLTRGWINFDQICDLNVIVDLSSGIIPPIAHDVLGSIEIRMYDKISSPKFKRRISMPQVINTLFKNLL